MSGLGHFIPAVKPHLLASWRLHSAWSRAELPCRAPPFTPLLAYALAQLPFNMVRGTQRFLSFRVFTLLQEVESFSQLAAQISCCLHSRAHGPCHFPNQASAPALKRVCCLMMHVFAPLCRLSFGERLLHGDSLSVVGAGIQRKRLQSMLHDLQVTTPRFALLMTLRSSEFCQNGSYLHLRRGCSAFFFAASPGCSCASRSFSSFGMSFLEEFVLTPRPPRLLSFYPILALPA